MCDYCGQAEESLTHLFCECDITTGVWQDLIDWLGKQRVNTEYLTDTQIILGEPKFDPVINRIFVTTKLIIFRNKVEGRTPRLTQVIASLKSQFITERYLASNNNKGSSIVYGPQFGLKSVGSKIRMGLLALLIFLDHLWEN